MHPATFRRSSTNRPDPAKIIDRKWHVRAAVSIYSGAAVFYAGERLFVFTQLTLIIFEVLQLSGKSSRIPLDSYSGLFFSVSAEERMENC